MKRIFHSLFLLLIASSLFPLSSLKAQPTQSISLTGKVKEATTNKPIPYATVAIIDGEGKTRGAVTAEDGGFEITTPTGKMTLVVSCMGYAKHEAEQEVAKAEDLGDIFLQPDTKELDEVVVKAVKPMIRREVGKIVLDAKSLAPIATNAIDLLRRTPGLLVSDDGSVTVVGKGSLLILINGQEKHMTGQEFGTYLRGLQAGDIKTIEVMTIPPAKYSAEGDVGIVNIVLQRKLSDYFGGTVSDIHFVDKEQANDASLSLKYQNGSLFLYANGRLGLGNWLNETVYDKRYQARRLEQHQSDKRSNLYTDPSVGFEWGLPKNFTLGGHYSGLYFEPDHEVRDEVASVDNATNTESHFQGLTQNSHRLLRHTGGLFVKKNWGEKSAVFDVSYLHNDVGMNDRYSATGDNTFKYNNQTNLLIDLWKAKLDLEFPISAVMMECGTSYQHTTSDNVAHYLENPLLPDQHDAFLHKEQIGAVYADAVFQPFAKVMTRLGLRGEGVVIDAKQRDMDRKINNSRWNVFPTFYLNYTPWEKHSFSLSFGRRIRRPHFLSINPFVKYTDPYSMSVGNPDLQPSLAYNAELGYTLNNNLNVAVSYRVLNNDSHTVPRVLGDGTVLYTKENSSDNRIILLSASYRWFPARWFNAMVGGYGYHMRGTSNAYEKPIVNQDWVVLAYSALNFYFNDKRTWMAEIETQYMSPEQYPLFVGKPRFYLHTALRYRALGGKLNISAQVQNLLKNNTGHTQVTPEYKEELTNDVRRRLRFSLSYNFGGSIKKREYSVRELYERLGD